MYLEIFDSVSPLANDYKVPLDISLIFCNGNIYITTPMMLEFPSVTTTEKATTEETPVIDATEVCMFMHIYTYVTGFAKTVLKGTFCISRNTNLKY